MVCKVRGSNDFCGDGVAVCDVMARAVWRAKSMTATTYMDNGATACNGMAGAVTISVAMVEFLALFAQEPTHVPRAHGLSAVVNLFWTHFLKNYSCSLMFNTIGIQYLTLPQKLQSNIIDIDGRIEYRPTEIVAVIY